MRIPQFRLVLVLLASALPAGAASYYTQRLEDPKAAYVTSPGSGDATALLQEAINRVQETGGQGGERPTPSVAHAPLSIS
ncbi:MAG: hypothetical protein ACLQM8_28940 [Limisphaerales bacterium]